MQYNSITKFNQFNRTHGDVHSALHAKLRRSVLGKPVPLISFTLHSTSWTETESVREKKR